MDCVYCGSNGPFTDEHVLSRTFADSGENWILRDLVCAVCNTHFSGYERAWASAPLEAIARVWSGPAGRGRNGRAYQIHPSEHIFLTAETDPVSYEVDILRGLEPRLRAQLVMTPDSLKVCAGFGPDLERFNIAINKFWMDKEITIQKRSRKSDKQFRVAVLSLDEEFSFLRVELRSKPANAWLDRFTSNFNVNSEPRVSVDAHGRLRFRVKKLREVALLLNRGFHDSIISSKGKKLEGGTYTVAFRSVFHEDKVFRAVAKTVINYAVDQFGKDWIAAKEFRPVLDYCIGREKQKPSNPFVGIIKQDTGIAAIDSCSREKHALALTSDGNRVIGLVKLYGTITYRVHIGLAPRGVSRFQRQVQIDFNGVGRV